MARIFEIKGSFLPNNHLPVNCKISRRNKQYQTAVYFHTYHPPFGSYKPVYFMNDQHEKRNHAKDATTY